MEIIEHTIETKATPTQIWKVWEDVNNWKTWDLDIEFSRIDGPFQSGTTGSTKFIKTHPFKTKLTKVEPHQLVVQEAYVLLAKVVSYQSMRSLNGNTQVTFRVEIRGPFAFLYACIIGRFIKKKIPKEMEEMVKRALV